MAADLQQARGVFFFILSITDSMQLQFYPIQLETQSDSVLLLSYYLKLL